MEIFNTIKLRPTFLKELKSVPEHPRQVSVTSSRRYRFKYLDLESWWHVTHCISCYSEPLHNQLYSTSIMINQCRCRFATIWEHTTRKTSRCDRNLTSIDLYCLSNSADHCWSSGSIAWRNIARHVVQTHYTLMMMTTMMITCRSMTEKHAGGEGSTNCDALIESAIASSCIVAANALFELFWNHSQLDFRLQTRLRTLVLKFLDKAFISSNNP